MSDDLGFNKIAAALLATGLGFMLVREVPHMLTHTEYPDVPAYSLGVPETGGDTVVVEVPFPSPEFIAAMNASDGERVFKKCTSCHNADKGGANGTGPNLFNVVGQEAGQHAAGFSYSSAMSGSGVTWNYEELNDFLTKPSKYIKGTAMNYIGLKKEEQRAAVIEYLRLKSDAPLPQPEAALPTEMVEAPEEEGVTPEGEQTETEAAVTPDETVAPAPEDTPTENTPAEDTPETPENGDNE